MGGATTLFLHTSLWSAEKEVYFVANIYRAADSMKERLIRKMITIIEVKLALEQAMKAQKGRRGTALLFL